MSMDKDISLHSLGVAKRMRDVSLNLNPDDTKLAEDMFVLGILHDIGYEFCGGKDNHAEVGGVILSRKGYKYSREVYHHGKPGVLYESEALTLLNKADLMINMEGEQVTVSTRLDDVKKTYGEKSKKYEDLLELAKELRLIRM